MMNSKSDELARLNYVGISRTRLVLTGNLPQFGLPNNRLEQLFMLKNLLKRIAFEFGFTGDCLGHGAFSYVIDNGDCTVTKITVCPAAVEIAYNIQGDVFPLFPCIHNITHLKEIEINDHTLNCFAIKTDKYQKVFRYHLNKEQAHIIKLLDQGYVFSCTHKNLERLSRLSELAEMEQGLKLLTAIVRNNPSEDYSLDSLRQSNFMIDKEGHIVITDLIFSRKLKNKLVKGRNYATNY